MLGWPYYSLLQVVLGAVNAVDGFTAAHRYLTELCARDCPGLGSLAFVVLWTAGSASERVFGFSPALMSPVWLHSSRYTSHVHIPMFHTAACTGMQRCI